MRPRTRTPVLLRAPVVRAGNPEADEKPGLSAKSALYRKNAHAGVCWNALE